MSEHLDSLADLIGRNIGIRLERERHQALCAALARAWPGVGHAEIARRALDPVTSAGTLNTLVDEITIKETSFLRDRRQLDTIDWHGLYANARAIGSPVVRVWSVACATGEEPYSLALLACEAFGSATPPVSILATDVSRSALAAAAAGHYRERSVQPIGDRMRERYLLGARDRFEVIPALRGLVSTAHHNLVSDPCPPLGERAFHLTLCRNVLIYFDGETCAHVVARLEGALAPHGKLMLGAADALCVLDRAATEFRQQSPRHRAPSPAAPRRTRPRMLPETRAAATNMPDADPMNPEVQYLHGLDQLESGNPVGAVLSLRRVLYLDPEFELAAFALGRAHEETGERAAARRRYQQALRLLGSRRQSGERLTGAIDAAAVIGACEARLAVLADGETPRGQNLDTREETR